jgi:hypothetical protein
MKIFSSFALFSYRTLYIFDPARYIEHERPCDFKQLHIDQNFFAWPGMFVFFLITDNGTMHIDVFKDEPARFNEKTICAIEVPFTVMGDDGIVVEPLMGENRAIPLPKGEYSLVIEQAYMYSWKEADMAGDSTPSIWLKDIDEWDVPKVKGQYGETEGIEADEVDPDEQGIMPMIMCRIWLNPATNVEAKILVQNTVANSNYPLNPTYPLVIDEPPEHIRKK